MLVLTAWATSLSAQITREQADMIVLEHIQNEVTPPYFLYVNVNTPTAEGIAITTSQAEAMQAKYACWVYYLNENPVMSAPSQHRYLFVKEDDGNLLEVITSNDLVPELTDWTEVMPVGIEAPPSPLERDVRIYPNPTSGLLTICDVRYATSDNRKSEIGQSEIEIFDVMGRTVVVASVETRHATSLQSEIGQSEIGNRTFDLSKVPAGIYFLRITTEDDVVVRKVVKE